MKVEKLTAKEIKFRVKNMVNNQMGLISKSDPYHRQQRAARMAAREALAYLSDERYQVSPVARNAIKDWAADLNQI